MGVASELVQYEKRYDGVFQNLLGRTVVVEDLDCGVTMARRYQNRFRIVENSGITTRLKLNEVFVFGAGDLPDNLQPLYDELLEQQPDLSNVRFGAVGIGSREYDTFCGAIEKVEAAVTSCGAKQLGETLKINILDHDIPEDPAEIWLAEWKNLLKND